MMQAGIVVGPPSSARAGFRGDIQLLRALAILLVLAHHARLPFVPGGFLGVDVFFVISGFLMGGMIDKALAERRFSLADFYARRARRILPASYCTLAFTVLGAVWLLDSTELRQFFGQLVGSLSFTANIVLWKQADYFGSGAELKPLLHMWSLAVEEQFYLFLPFALMVFAHRWRPALAAAIVAVSLGLCFWLMQSRVSAAFYLTPARVWELGIGVVVALGVNRGQPMPVPMPALRLGCWAVLLAVPLLVGERGHPGWAALLLCLATALLLVPGAPALPRARPFALLQATGDRSYSLYLVHWPLFAFANTIWIDRVPPAVNLGLLLLCFGLTELQYRFVEQRFRHIRVDRRAVLLLIAIPAALALAAAAALAWRVNGLTPLRSANTGIGDACALGYLPEASSSCSSSGAARVAVWGDSFAMHIAPGVAATSDGRVEQLTKIFCGPFIGIAPVDSVYPPEWGKKCLAFNRESLTAITRDPSIRLVVLSSSIGQYLPGAEGVERRLLIEREGRETGAGQSEDQLFAALQRTVNLLRAAGKRVVMIAPPPSVRLDMGRCRHRMMEALPLVAADAGCDFPESLYRKEKGAIQAFLREVEARHIVPVLRLDAALCTKGVCVAGDDRTIFYSDHAHLSIAGSLYVATRQNWRERLYAMAR